MFAGLLIEDFYVLFQGNHTVSLALHYFTDDARLKGNGVDGNDATSHIEGIEQGRNRRFFVRPHPNSGLAKTQVGIGHSYADYM